MFKNREDAGRRLAEALAHLKEERPVVIGLPRGGVPVAFQVAQALEAPLDLALVRKIGAPGQPELAIGAVVDGEDEHVIVNRRIADAAGADDAFIARQAEAKVAEIEERRRRYFGGLSRPALQGRTAIVIDDGIATGATLRAALAGLRHSGVGKLVVAVPVGPPDTIAALREEADDVVCLEQPAWFAAVGQAYEDFTQTTDDELIALLRRAADARTAAGGY
jgi:putative phosphoribosyl transferase